MKKLLSFILVIVLAQTANAQIGKLMSKYQEKDGFTVTRLDKSLYGLYKKGTLSAEAENLLKNLDEVNILNLNLVQFASSEADVAGVLKSVLNDGSYRMVKSHRDQGRQQQVYAKTNDGKLNDLVIWNRSDKRLDVIELRGNINTDDVALLAKTLNIKGLGAISVISNDPDPRQSNMGKRSYQNYEPNPDSFESNQDSFEQEYYRMPSLSQMMAEMDNFFGAVMTDFNETNDFPSMFSNLGSMSMNAFSAPTGANLMSSSVQICQENGKTKIKINAEGQNMSYIVDGQIVDGEEITLPERIRMARVVGDPTDPYKQYLLVMSNNKLGEFVSFKNNKLTFKYNDQMYTYQLEGKMIICVNGQMTDQFSIDPASINQIRKVEDIEKQIGCFGPAEVIVNTK